MQIYTGLADKDGFNLSFICVYCFFYLCLICDPSSFICDPSYFYP